MESNPPKSETEGNAALPEEHRIPYLSDRYAGVVFETWRDMRVFVWLTDNFPEARVFEEGSRLGQRGFPGEIAIALRTVVPDDVYRPSIAERIERNVELTLAGVKVKLVPKEIALIAAVRHFLSCIDRAQTYDDDARAYVSVARMRAMSAGASGPFLDKLASRGSLITGAYKPAMQDKKFWLKVRPEDFSAAKESGAHFDERIGVWFVPPGDDIRRFTRFL